jgi:hypothetical protein
VVTVSADGPVTIFSDGLSVFALNWAGADDLATAIRRSLPAFFTDNRSKLITEVLRASEGLIIDRMGTLQPRDRRPLRVHLDVSPQPYEPGDRVQLRWVISPESR